MPTARKITFGRTPPPPQTYTTLADIITLQDAAMFGTTANRSATDLCIINETFNVQLTQEAARTDRVTRMYATATPTTASDRITSIWANALGSQLPSRDYLIYDGYIPTLDNVGVIGGLAALTDYNAVSTNSFTWTQGGTAANPIVISNKIIYGYVIRGASYVTFKNCLFLGPTAKPGNETAIIQSYDNTYLGWSFYDCTFAPRRPNANMDAIKGNNYKAFRCHAVYCVDGFGIFTNSGTRPTNVEIAGCLIEAMPYFPGTQYANANGSRLRTDGTYGSSGTFVLRADNAPAAEVAEIDNSHTDGNHVDGFEVQGGYGRMTRDAVAHPVTGIKRWTGDGIYIHGNAFDIYDAEANIADPTGLGLPVPGQSGSYPGSMLGYGDNPKRGVAQTPGMTRPVTGGQRMFNNRYAANGSAMIVVQNVNQFPYPTTAAPDDYTMVMVANYANGGNILFNGQAKGYSDLKVALLYNMFGPDIYRNGSSWQTNPQIYPIRIDYLSRFKPALADDGTDGMATNKWLDPQNRWGRNGQSLYWISPQVGSDATHTSQWAATGRYWTSAEAQAVRTSGVWYDNV